VGFTTRSEHRDPEEVRDLLSRYFDRYRVGIGRYGGTVEKFIGDAVMAPGASRTRRSRCCDHSGHGHCSRRHCASAPAAAVRWLARLESQIGVTA